ncbi:MAG: site-specific integrase [Candidatus Woesearchaeota archaeon]
MADNDIYNNQKRYETFLSKLDIYCRKPDFSNRDEVRRKYWIKNKENKKHFLELAKIFSARDISFIRRLRLFRTFLIVCHVTDKDLASIDDRKDIDKVMTFAHTVNKSMKSKRDFSLDLKFLWKQLFPEKDERGRIDDTITPYVVRHLNGKIDKSKEKLRGDKFELDEFEQLVQAFADDSRMQCLLTVMLESLGRPQELLGRKIKDVELHENYAKLWVTEHGKEGTGFLRIIDSYFYLAKWINEHPNRKDKNAYLFVNTGRTNRHCQMTPTAANKLIRERCKQLGIKKPITLYSLKRNGVTIMRLRGASDLDIQHTARWTSTKQLKTYDLSTQEESFKIDLIKRGIIKADANHKEFEPTTKPCVFCGALNGLAESICDKCKRPLDHQVIEAEIKAKEEESKLQQQKIDQMQGDFSDFQKKIELVFRAKGIKF